MCQVREKSRFTWFRNLRELQILRGWASLEVKDSLHVQGRVFGFKALQLMMLLFRGRDSLVFRSARLTKDEYGDACGRCEKGRPQMDWRLRSEVSSRKVRIPGIQLAVALGSQYQ